MRQLLRPLRLKDRVDVFGRWIDKLHGMFCRVIQRDRIADKAQTVCTCDLHDRTPVILRLAFAVSYLKDFFRLGTRQHLNSSVLLPE